MKDECAMNDAHDILVCHFRAHLGFVWFYGSQVISGRYAQFITRISP